MYKQSIIIFIVENTKIVQQMIVYYIILISVMAVVLIAVNFYLLTHYIHRDDRKWKDGLYCKVLILLGLTICQVQALMIPLDINNQGRDSFDMATLWLSLYCAVLAFICVLAPFAIFLYETDEEKPLVRRMLRALLFTILSLVVSCITVFISWFFLKTASIPVQELTLKYMEPEKQNSEEKYMLVEVNVFAYFVAIQSLVGWLLLMVFGGIGLVSLPLDLINQFRRRPRLRKRQQMQQTRKKLVAALKTLLKSGKKLQESGDLLTRNSDATCLERFKGKRKINSGLGQLKARYFALTQEFQIFNLELKIFNSNPLVPFLKLALGITFALTSLVWIVQIVSASSLFATNNSILFPFLDQLFIALDEAKAELVSTFLFAYLSIYMLWCVQKGNIKFGITVPFCCRFHPMKEKQTWLNSFLFNVTLMSMASVAISQFSVRSFPVYTRNSQIHTLLAVNLNYLEFYSILFSNHVFVFALLGFSLLTLAYLLVTCNRKPKYMQDIEQIREWGRTRRKQQDVEGIVEEDD